MCDTEEMQLLLRSNVGVQAMSQNGEFASIEQDFREGRSQILHQVDKMLNQSQNISADTSQPVEYDMKVLSLVLHLYANIAASGHEYLSKLISETSVQAILGNILSSNLAAASEDLMSTCVRMVELIGTLSDWKTDDQDENTEGYQRERRQVLDLITGVAKMVFLNSQVIETGNRALSTLTKLSEKVVEEIPNLASNAVIDKMI